MLQRGKGLANRGESSQKAMAHFPIRISEYRKRSACDEDHSDLEGKLYDSSMTQVTCYQVCASPWGESPADVDTLVRVEAPTNVLYQ